MPPGGAGPTALGTAGDDGRRTAARQIRGRRRGSRRAPPRPVRPRRGGRRRRRGLARRSSRDRGGRWRCRRRPSGPRRSSPPPTATSEAPCPERSSPHTGPDQASRCAGSVGGVRSASPWRCSSGRPAPGGARGGRAAPCCAAGGRSVTPRAPAPGRPPRVAARCGRSARRRRASRGGPRGGRCERTSASAVPHPIGSGAVPSTASTGTPMSGRRIIDHSGRHGPKPPKRSVGSIFQRHPSGVLAGADGHEVAQPLLRRVEGSCAGAARPARRSCRACAARRRGTDGGRATR